MANQILFTPNDNNLGTVKNKVMVGGNNFTGDLISFNGKVFVIDLENLPDELNPLNLPTNTIRVKFKSGYEPTMGDTQTLVDANENIWDINRESNNWTYLFDACDSLLEVLGGNTTNVTNMYCLFAQCDSLTTLALFDTSNVTNAMFFCTHCYSLTNIPLYNTSNMTHINRMFALCHNVEHGALALYRQASSQTSVPVHLDAFWECGRDTQTGAAELEQIPNDWK